MRSIQATCAFLSLLAVEANAISLDLSDPTPRSLLVEIENSVDDTVVGSSYHTPVTGSYSSDGTTGQIVVPSLTLEMLYQGVGGFPPIPGTFTDLIIDIDLASLEATVQPLTTAFVAPGGNFGYLGNLLDTTAVGGEFANFNGVFCTAAIPESPCTLIPGAPYDPTTGRLNAIGSRVVPFDPETGNTNLPPFFDPHGDLRLSEVPEPGTALLVMLGLAGLGKTAGRRPLPRA